MEPITVAILLLGGLFAGIINTIVGGGSLISVPLLITSGLPAHIAIGTNRFAMIFNSGTGAIDYYRQVKYKIKSTLLLAILASIGSYLGANIVLQIDEATLNYIIGILMLIMGGVVFYKKNIGLEEKKIEITSKNQILIIILSFLLGIYGGFFGAGVSTMFTFVFVLFLGKSFLKSAGMTRLIVTIVSVVAAITFLFYGKVYFLHGAILSVSFILGAKIGVKFAVKAGNIWLRRGFMLLVIISSIKMFFF